jgi:hypothetical protein
MFEPAKFTHKNDQEIVIISVDFLNDHHAEAFKSHFDGQEPDADFFRKNELEPPAGTIGQRRTGDIPGTMAQACWWLLLVEEIRTEADNFGSDSARETMELAARGWEQLAEELEHRLATNGGHHRKFLA